MVTGVPFVPSIENTTEPSGAPAELDTVAVNVTSSPTALGFCDDAKDVVVAPASTVCVNAGDVLASKSPEAA